MVGPPCSTASTEAPAIALWSFASVTWPLTIADGGNRNRMPKPAGGITASLNEYWSASVPPAFSMPIVAESPCWRVVPPTFVYCVRIRPLAYSVTSKFTRSVKSPKKATLRHSMVKALGGEPSVWVHMLAEPSTNRSSQKG